MDDQPLPVYGDGRQVRDWLFVKDNCEALDLLLHKGEAGEVYNVGAGNERPNMDVVEGILDLLGKPRSLIRFVEDRPGPRPPLRAGLREDPRARLVAAPRLRGVPRRDRPLVRRQPRLVGEDQVGLLPRLLRAAVRRPPRLRPQRPARLAIEMRIFVTGNRGQLGRELDARSPPTTSRRRPA